MDRRSFLVRLATGSVAISTSGWTQMSALYPFTAGQPSTEGSENLDARLRSISERLETYLFDHFFDGDGILYAYIDVETGKPFTPEYMSTQYLDIFHVPDPVHYWSNEDSMQYSGYLLAALYEKYTATRDS